MVDLWLFGISASGSADSGALLILLPSKAGEVSVLPLHPHLVGVPHRMNWFVKILDLLLARSDTVFLNGGQIADWYEKVEPAPR